MLHNFTICHGLLAKNKVTSKRVKHVMIFQIRVKVVTMLLLGGKMWNVLLKKLFSSIYNSATYSGENGNHFLVEWIYSRGCFQNTASSWARPTTTPRSAWLDGNPCAIDRAGDDHFWHLTCWLLPCVSMPSTQPVIDRHVHIHFFFCGGHTLFLSTFIWHILFCLHFYFILPSDVKVVVLLLDGNVKLVVLATKGDKYHLRPW